MKNKIKYRRPDEVRGVIKETEGNHAKSMIFLATVGHG